MKRFLIFLAVVLLASSALAGDFEWKQLEEQYVLDVCTFDSNPKLSITYINTRIHRFDLEQYALYVGPLFTLYYSDDYRNIKLWTNPKLGFIHDWYPEDAPLFSLFTGLNYGNWSMFVENDLYFKPHHAEYYGIYFLDYRNAIQDVPLVIGFGVEQVKDQAWGGPRIGVEKFLGDALLNAELQYFLFLQDDSKGHNIRVVFRLFVE